MDTERPSPRYSDIDVWEPSDIAEAMIEGQFTAVAAVRAARFALVRAALAGPSDPGALGRLQEVAAACETGSARALALIEAAGRIILAERLKELT